MDIRAHVVFKGRVQGVLFRTSTKEAAKKEGVVGWVRNLPDGSVEAVFEGPKERVEKLIGLCKCSIPLARVDSADVEFAKATGAFRSFEIKH